MDVSAPRDNIWMSLHIVIIRAREERLEKYFKVLIGPGLKGVPSEPESGASRFYTFALY